MTKRTERIGLGEDERYPVYYPTEPDRYNGPSAEVDVDTLARWREVLALYEAVQGEMAAVYEAAEQRQRREAALEKAEKEAAEAQRKLNELRAQA